MEVIFVFMKKYFVARLWVTIISLTMATIAFAKHDDTVYDFMEEVDRMESKRMSEEMFFDCHLHYIDDARSISGHYGSR